MSDEIDQAQAYDQQFQAGSLHLQQQGREPADNLGIECIDCCEEIPEERRQAQPNCRRCITCQERFEIHNNWRAL